MIAAILFWLSVGAIFYTYAGYPALLFLLARTRAKPKPYPPAAPPVSLIIAAYNEEAIIGQKIENCLALDYPRTALQIIVADDGSTDRTAEIARRYADRGVELSSDVQRRGKAGAVTRAVGQARGDIVVFSDATNIYRPDALRELAAPFTDPRVGVVTGARAIENGDGALGDSEGLYWRYESFIQQQETRLGSCTAAAGDIYSIRRSLFEPPPEGVVVEDFYMAMRAIQRGYRVVHAPRARTSERVSLSAGHEVERRARMIAGRYQAFTQAHRWLPWRQPVVVWQVVSHKLLRPLVALFMLVALITNITAVAFPRGDSTHPWLLLAPPFGWIILALQAMFYLLAWLGSRLERSSSYGKFLYLPTFLVNSNLAAAIGLYRFLFKRQSALWSRAPRREALQRSDAEPDTVKRSG